MLVPARPGVLRQRNSWNSRQEGHWGKCPWNFEKFFPRSSALDWPCTIRGTLLLSYPNLICRRSSDGLDSLASCWCSSYPSFFQRQRHFLRAIQWVPIRCEYSPHVLQRYWMNLDVSSVYSDERVRRCKDARVRELISLMSSSQSSWQSCMICITKVPTWVVQSVAGSHQTCRRLR